MYDVSVNVVAKIIEPNKRIRIEWPGYSGPTTVEWTFVPHDDATFVTVSESGWTGDADKLMKYVADWHAPEPDSGSLSQRCRKRLTGATTRLT